MGLGLAGSLALAGTVVSAGAAVASGIAQGQAASYQSKVAENNAKIAQNNAQYSAEATAARTEAAGLKAGAEQANLRAAIGANNIDVNTGSAETTQESERRKGAQDIATVNSNSALQVYGYESQATGFQAQSDLYGAEAAYAPIAGAVKGVGTGLSGAGSVLGKDPSAPSPNTSWMQVTDGATSDDLFGRLGG